MLFGTTAPLDALILWCRALRHGLDVGLSPVKVFRQQAKSGPSALRDVAGRAADRLERGESLEQALKPEAKRFPPLFLELVSVGEHAGRLPDIFAELEEHFETMKVARRSFQKVLYWPLFEYVGAIFVLFVMQLVLGMFGSPLDPLGLGLTGVKGAFAFLFGAVLFTVAVVVVVLFVANNPQVRAKVESVGLAIPGLGGCFRAFALSRFCMAYYMTAEAGMRADRCLRFSLRATANKAYAREAEFAAKAARKGEDVPSILGGYGPRLFPDDFLSSVQVGEDSGRLAEVMKKQAAYYREESHRKVKFLAMIAGGLVYLCIGLLMVGVIFKIAMKAYINPLNDAMNAADNPDAWLRGK
jgi:type II secretory pathway component PulF